MAAKIKETNVDFTYQVYHGEFHDFQLLFPMEEQSQEAWKEIAAFLARFQ